MFFTECPYPTLPPWISQAISSKLWDFLMLDAVTNKYRLEAIQRIWKLYLNIFQRSNPEKMPSSEMASHAGLKILYWIRTTCILQLLRIHILNHVPTQCRNLRSFVKLRVFLCEVRCSNKGTLEQLTSRRRIPCLLDSIQDNIVTKLHWQLLEKNATTTITHTHTHKK